MNTIAVYASKEKLTPQHQPLKVGDNDIVLYLRAVRLSHSTTDTELGQLGEKLLGTFELE